MLLVRHSVPAPDPSVPSEEWRLSEEGRALCERLALQVGAYEPQRLLSSPEPKTLETAELIAPQSAFITHGTVMSLYVAGSDPDGGFAYWKTLGLPHVVKQ